MNIKYYSKEIIEQMDPIKGHLLISLLNPEHSLNLKDGWDKVLMIKCHDVHFDTKKYSVESILKKEPHLVFFNSGHAKEILDASDHFDGITVHCYAGKSRSKTVADFLNFIKYGIESENDYKNSHIHKILTEEYLKKVSN